MQVKEIMSARVKQIAPNATLQNAAETMAREDIGFLAVTDGEAPGDGVLTDRDIVIRCIAEHRDPTTTLVQDCMSPEVTTISEDCDAAEAAQMMRQKKIRRLLVVGPKNRLTGVVSLGDLATQTHDSNLCGQVLEDVSAT